MRDWVSEKQLRDAVYFSIEIANFIRSYTQYPEFPFQGLF